MTDLDVRQTTCAETPIGEIAVQLPGATAVFRKLKLDYCCGGAVSLATAAAKRGLDLADIERRLAALVLPPIQLPDAPADMIDLIIARYHDVHRREFPELIQLARRVERVHADHPQAPKGLADFLELMQAELGAHMEKEELVLFPMMRVGHPMVAGPVAVMRAEHEDHGEALDGLAALTHDFEPPPGSCGSWRALYKGLRKLSDDLIEHIHTENNLLFPRFTA